MNIVPTELPEVKYLEVTRHDDRRGFFARAWDAEIAKAFDAPEVFETWAFSGNASAGTLRGLHWQADPHAETKLVRCIQGEIWDVAVDMRRDSETFGSWVGRSLTAERLDALYIPAGFAHGFLTLRANTLVQYGISGKYDRNLARGARWDDPALAIEWPRSVKVISERDASYPLIEAGRC